MIVNDKPSLAWVIILCYEGDFEYQENGQWIVEDVKGAETDVWKLKRKMFLANYPTAHLRVISASRYSKR